MCCSLFSYLFFSVVSVFCRRLGSEGLTHQCTWQLLHHDFFRAIDLDQLYRGAVQPPYVPNTREYLQPATDLSPARTFKGDDKQFAGF